MFIDLSAALACNTAACRDRLAFVPADKGGGLTPVQPERRTRLTRRRRLIDGA